MKNLLIGLFLLLNLNFLFAQTPLSHQPGVSFTYSGSYYATGGEATTNFLMCDSWNSGTYGGWLQMDLGSTISLESLRWWVSMFPNGNVQTELVEVSDDGSNWILAANTSGPHAAFEEIKLVFDPVIPNVRYIRISQSGTPSWFAILEMIVNEPYYANNIFANMPPKVLDSLGRELTEPVGGLPYNFICSKAATYQWYKDGVAISGANNQNYLATTVGNYSCAVSYASANCGFPTTSDPIPLSPLPLDLLSFEVRTQKEQALLNWEVDNLFRFSHFEIQRSLNGSTFEKVAQVNTAGGGEYAYSDFPLSTGTIYYRLKMIDQDGSFIYSPVKALAWENSNFQIYPNPAQHTLNIHSEAAPFHFSIYDFSGQVFHQGQSEEKDIPLPILHFPKGLYFIKVAQSDHILQFVVQ